MSLPYKKKYERLVEVIVEQIQRLYEEVEDVRGRGGSEEEVTQVLNEIPHLEFVRDRSIRMSL